jgi:MFS family permease
VTSQEGEPARAGGIALLRSNGAYLRLWLARAISFLGDSLGLIALILYASHQPGGAVAVALLLLAGDFVPGLLSPFSGLFSDRLPRRDLMVVCELLRGSVIAVIALAAPPLVPLLALVALQAVVGTVFRPASQGAVAELVEDHDLPVANATLGFGTNGLEVLGPALGALLLPFLAVRGVLLADAATFVVSALLLLRLPALASSRGQMDREGILGATRAGMAATWRMPVVRAVAIAFFVVVAFTGVDDVALVFLARQLGAGDAVTSLLYAGSGVGLMVALALLTRFARHVPVPAQVVLGFALSSGGNLATGLARAVPVAFLTQSVRGAGLSLIDVGVNTFLQRRVPPEIQGRVFANVYGAVGIAAGISYVAGGVLVQMLGPRPVFVVAGAGGVLTAGVLAIVLARAHSRAQPV